MALKYHLVQRLDKSKDAAAGSKLYYGQIRAQQKLEFNKLCEIIASYSTASRGDVMLVIDGLLYVMRQHLENGEVVQVGDFGNFRMLVQKGAYRFHTGSHAKRSHSETEV